MILDRETFHTVLAEEAQAHDSPFVSREVTGHGLHEALSRYYYFVRDTGEYAAAGLLWRVMDGDMSLPLRHDQVMDTAKHASRILMGHDADMLEKFLEDELAQAHVFGVISACQEAAEHSSISDF